MLRTFAAAVRRVLFPRFVLTVTRSASLTAVRVSLRSVNKFRSLVAKLHSYGCIVKCITSNEWSRRTSQVPPDDD